MTSVATFETNNKNNNIKFGHYIDSIANNQNIGVTWNGDFNYSSLGETIDNLILELKQKLLNNIIERNLPKDNGIGTHRKGYVGLPKDSTLNIPESFRNNITLKMNTIMSKIKELSEKEQCMYIDMLFRSIFHERAIPRSGQGKGHKSLMFYLWHEMYKHMPKTSLQLLELLPEYGCFRDLDNIMHHYIDNNYILNEEVVNKCIDVYYSYLCKDFKKLFDMDMTILSHSELRSRIEKTYHKIKKNETMTNKKEYPSISLVGKFIGRENKKFDFNRELLLSKIFMNGNYERYKSSSRKFRNFAHVTLRYYLFILNTIIGTVEMKMSSHNYKDIDPTKMTSGSSLKYRKYLLNETMDNEDRSYEKEAILLRDRTIKASFDNAIKGSGLDSVKLSNVIGKNFYNKTISTNEKQIINSQFNSLFESIKNNLKEEYDKLMIKWVEEGSVEKEKPLDPFNVIATIDVSGSMSCANVLNPAVLLGIIVTKLSNIGNTFITFSESPDLININENEDIFEIFGKVIRTNWGGCTNIDKANLKLAQLMRDYKKINPDFSGEITHIIFTDGQFNGSFVQGWTTNYSYNDTTKVMETSWNTAVNRMEKYFTNYNLSLPNTVFWNMNADSPGFPTSGDMRGLQLAEGLSHGMLVSILTNACEYSLDENHVKKSNITPVESFRKTVYHPYFDKVSEVVHHTKEGVFKNEENHQYSINLGKYVNN